MTLEPIDKPESISDRAYNLLYNAIIAMRLKPGDSLSENKIAEQLAVSKTPVREALKRLQEHDLIVTVPQKGTFVAGINPKQVHDACEVRVALECHAIAKAVGRITQEDLAQMVQRNDDAANIEAHEDEITPFAARRAFLTADLEFHDIIWRAAGNELLRRTVANIYDHLARVRLWALEQPQHIDRILRQHARIVAALEAEDTDEAVDAMHDHLQSTMISLEAMMEALPDYFDEIPE